MTFQPIVPLSGYSGWRFLQRTLDVQQQAFNTSTQVQRATDYFREKIGGIGSAEELMADRRLREVALGAFGLDDDIDSTFFIKKILSESTADDEALVNRLSDKRYREMADAFGFGRITMPKTGLAGFAEGIIAKYEAKQFQQAVGEQNNDFRVALNIDDGLGTIVARNTSNDSRWFAIMGDPPVRAAFEFALGLPSSIAQIDLDQQLDNFKTRARAVFGTDDIGQINTAENREKLVRLFLIRSEAAQFAATSNGSVALTLLQSIQPITARTGF